MKFAPQRISVTNEEVELATKIASSQTTIARYLRHKPTVELARVAPRDIHGAIIPDAPLFKVRVISRGIPYGCLVAFLDLEGLPYIGWSRRIKTEEDDFEKKRGKITAVLRGLKDTIILDAGVRSEVSKIVPHDIAKALLAFIPRMEKHFAVKIINIK